MQKILNDPEPFVDEMLDGILAAHPDQLRRPSPRAIVRADAPVANKVGIATGGGSGHLPVFMGYVGRGLIDGAAIGNVFASPSRYKSIAGSLVMASSRSWKFPQACLRNVSLCKCMRYMSSTLV